MKGDDSRYSSPEPPKFFWGVGGRFLNQGSDRSPLLQGVSMKDWIFNQWLNIGIKQGWITEPYCSTHDGPADMSDEEWQDWEDGFDPCSVVVRVNTYSEYYG